MASGKHFTDLPDELLLIIFSNLSIEDLAMSVQHVNSHWKNVSQDDSLWEYQTFSPGCKMSDEEISRHLRNMPALRSFCPSRGTNTKVVDTLCKYCRDIRHIYFGYSHKLSNSTLHQILKKFPHIEKLVIPLPKETDQLHFADLVAQLKKLTTLSFTSHCVSTVANGVLRAIADGCPSLQCVDMGFSKSQTKDIEYFLEKRGQQLSSFSVRSYISTVAHRLLTECANLESLTYHNLNADLPDTYIQSLSKMSEMRELVLRYFREGQTRNVSSIFKNQSMSKLITLYLYDSDDFDGSSLAVILTNCPQLQRLTVHECGLTDDDDVMEHIFKCKQLEVLELSHTSHLLGINFHLIPSTLVHLTELHVHGCSSLDKKCMDKLKEEMPHLLIAGIYTRNEETDVNLGDAKFFISQFL
ncbi:hypothetical protein B7P43_G17486 [Cryptotermes secundus]|uniref:F-box domain-containing protein n=1 Tax=Cryptotermes secundus TaxID=105785 RepID=A0A2J7Q1A3_9NEOP|nr:hypothetical protein B7P43_G17486 [Cryptotermes secundus]